MFEVTITKITTIVDQRLFKQLYRLLTNEVVSDLRVLIVYVPEQGLLNAKNLAPPFISIFVWIKINDFKNQCSLVFKLLLQKKVCKKSCAQFLGEKCKI